MGGNEPGEGCVITRERDKTIDVWEMNSDPYHPWFILQTNNDHWKPAPILNDRVIPGNICMQKLGEKVRNLSLINFLDSELILHIIINFILLN